MSVKVGINGLGRIGKRVLSAWLDGGFDDIEIVMINDMIETSSFVHMLKYDSVHGTLKADLKVDGNHLIINGTKKIAIVSSPVPSEIPWKEQGVDVVFECTGRFTEKEKAELHCEQGVKKVIISAPAKNPDLTVVIGVNDDKYDPAKHHIISNASCTTNCLGPVVKVIHDKFGIERGLMTTIHSYTNDQKILDTYHKDPRRARAGALSMIPTTTGAAKAIGLVMPELAGKLDGLAIRVPTPNVSVVDLVVKVSKKGTKEEVNDAIRKAADGPLKGILGYSDEPLVSSDFNGSRLSSVVDTALTSFVGDDLLKVLSWYDNETAFSYRMLDLVGIVGKNL